MDGDASTGYVLVGGTVITPVLNKPTAVRPAFVPDPSETVTAGIYHDGANIKNLTTNVH